MNHDDEKKSDLQPWIEPELEARIVAAVLGEASAFETAELERLAAEKPELVIFKRRIEAVHGLVGAAVRPESAPLRLAPERRAKILQVIGATPKRSTDEKPNGPEVIPFRKKRSWGSNWIWASGVAATLVVGMFVALQNSDYAFRRKPVRPDPSQTVLGGLNTSAMDADRADFKAQAPQPPPEMLEAREVRPEPFQTVSGPSISFSRVAAPELAKGRNGSGAETLTWGDRRDGTLGAKQEKLTLIDDVAKRRESDRAQLQAQSIQITTSASLSDQRAAAATSRAARSNAPKVASRAANVPTPDNGYFDFGGAALPGGGGGRNLTFGLDSKNAGKKDEFLSFRTDAPNPASPPPPATAASNQKAQEETVMLSPFTVSTSKDKGYAAANTLSGSRLKSLNEGTSVRGMAGGGGYLTLDGEVLDTKAIANARFAQAVELSVVDVNDRFRDDNFLSSAPSEPVPQVFALTAATEDQRLSQQKAAATLAEKKPAEPASDSLRAEVRATQQPMSTFSLHVSDASFRIAQAAIARGTMPDPERIRPEEFYNAFNYGDPSPVTADKVFCRIEQSAHPIAQQRNLVRIAMKVPATGRGAGQPLHLTVLLDTSGSMEREDRIASVRRALEVLATLLGANDRVTLIGFAREPRLIADNLPGDQAGKLADLAARTPFTGGTNLEEALKLAGDLAKRSRDASAQNRIVLLTDGAANLGNANPVQLAAMIESLRQEGLAFDACGIGTDGLDDTILEALTRKGDGRYYVIDKAEDADTGFARQLAGAFRPAAENVKVQVRFNPSRVGNYRLIGFEQHRLREEDFRNDKVDAAELAAEEAAVAVYQVEVLPQGEGELGDVFVRFRDTASGQMVERSWTMLHEPQARAFDRATPTMQLAGVAALVAEKLRGGEAARAIELSDLAPVVNQLRGHYANDAHVQELVAMFEQLRRREGR